MQSIFGDIPARKSLQSTTLVLILLVSFLAGSTLPVRAQAPSLFADAGVAAADVGQAKVLRSRLVSANLNLLLDSNGQPLDATTAPQLLLNLFADTNYTGVVTQVTKYDADTHTWSGVLQNITGGYFYLATSGGKLAGHVASMKGVYEITSAANGLYRIDQLDESKMVDEPNEGRDIPLGDFRAVANTGNMADGPGRIDVMVLYTSTARVAAGGTSGMNAQLALAMTETNTAYANAGITTRLRLVHAQEVSYPETGDLFTDLPRLVNPADGYIDSAAGLRNAYGADMVSLIVNNGGSYCGLANAIMATADGAAAPYDVVALSCMTGYYSFAHEFGHLQGARHDLYVDNTTTDPVGAFNHGYVHAVASAPWRTVMAYNNRCTDFGLNCTRLQYFSNPNNLYGGAVMGAPATSRNFAVLNTTALTVANFRGQVIGENFVSPFTAAASGWNPTSGSWVLSGSAYYTTPGVAGFWANVSHVARYGDLTYTATMYRAGSDPIYSNGIIIRGTSALGADRNWRSGYLFVYANDGQFSVWKMMGGGYTLLTGWTTSSAIHKGSWNTLKVVAVGPRLRFFINNVLVWAGSNTALSVGQVGITMFRDAATTGDRLWVDSAVLSTTPTAADVLPADVAPGIALPGGDPTKAP